MKKIPNVSPKMFSLSAIAVGYLLIDDMTATEQNALGNWLMLTAQLICTNAYYKQLQQERNINEQINNSDTITILEKMKKALEKEIDEIKNSK